jgi:GTP pyrophosphokinase
MQSTTRIIMHNQMDWFIATEFKAIINTGMDTFGAYKWAHKVISNNMQVNIQIISLNGDAGLFKGQLIVVVPEQ